MHDGYTFKYFITDLAEIGGKTSNIKTNPVDGNIYGVTPWGEIAVGLKPMHNWTEYETAPERSVDMSKRLTKFLNTYWDASRWPVAITRNDPVGTRSLNETTSEPPENLAMNKTEAILRDRFSFTEPMCHGLSR